MPGSYKLTDQIKAFIIEKKRNNPELSCRKLIPLIRQRFQVSLSKSLINCVIKQNKLSSRVGRRKAEEQVVFKTPIEIRLIMQERVIIQNGGAIFLKIADFKLGLTSILANSLFAYYPGISEGDLQSLVEAVIYTPLFQNKKKF